MSASEEKDLSQKLDSAMAISKENSPDSVAEKELYTSELRGSDESGEGAYKVPYKTIAQAMRVYGKEPFPTIYQDPKPESDAAKSGILGISKNLCFLDRVVIWSSDVVTTQKYLKIIIFQEKSMNPLQNLK